ncbi:MAG: PKD domain-containing protein, partial [Thermoplasmata archaeon]
MRKLISVTIVGVMMLTLIVGLFGGVVEEGQSSATYDPITNTIYIDGFGNLLWLIWLDIGNPNIFDQVGPDTYVTYANITINQNAVLTVNAGETLKFNGMLNLTVSGELNVNGVEGNMATFTSNNTSPSAGDWQGLKFNTTESSNSNVNYLNISYPIIGIYCYGSSPMITNSIITICSDNGIKSNGASPTLKNVEISNNGNGDITDAGLFVISSSPNIENSTFINNPNRDMLLQSDSHPVLLNSTFDFGKTFFSDVNSNLTVKWYLEIYVIDNNSGSPVQNAPVQVKDFFDNIVMGSPFTTNSQGIVRWIQVVEYVRSSSATVLHTPHNITVTHDEYYSGYAVPEPYIGSSKQVQINLTMIRRDLTTTSNDITFLPPGIPIAGENLTVYVTIYNVEVDDVHNVRVKIFDNTTGGAVELYHIIIPEIKGNGSYEISKKWKPTPGIHMIEVFIDPFGEINEINSTMPPGWAESNNYASTNISVNGRPLVNITDPDEGAEVNGTIFIIGTAYDDSRDDVMLFNNITQVDVRLEGHDWVELSIGLNLTYNWLLGIWEWNYGWDTTQWNSTPLSDGNYTINARAWDNYHFSHIYVVNITINNTGANTPPIAVISAPANFSAFNVSDVITFNGSESNDAQSSPEDLNFTWDLDDTVDSNGDGNYRNDEDAFGNVTNNAYERKGIFNVTLIVTDEGGLNDTTWITIVVWNHRPVANLSASNTTVYENQTVTFNASGSYDPDGVIISYLWNFEDGTILVTTWPVVTINHSFNESRIFNVTLTVTDNNVTSNTTWVLIDVLSNAAPVADIEEPNNLDAFSVNETIIFNGSSSYDPNDEDVEYYWD